MLGRYVGQVGGSGRRQRVVPPPVSVRAVALHMPVGIEEDSAVEARQHGDGVRQGWIVAECRYFLVVEGVMGEEADRGGKMLPGGAAIGGFVHSVERGAEQQSIGMMWRQRHGGEVGVRAYRRGDGYDLPRPATVLAQVQAAGGGGGHPQWVARVDSERGDEAVLRRMRKRMDHAVRQAGVAGFPGTSPVQGREHAGAARAGVIPVRGRHHLLEVRCGAGARRILARHHGHGAGTEEQCPQPAPHRAPPANRWHHSAARMWAMMRSANSSVATWVAPSIRRAKS